MEPLLSEERRALVAELLRVAGAVTIPELQARFGISPMTARRDLGVLAERGLARRTHGGAVVPAIGAHEDAFPQRAVPAAAGGLAEAAFDTLAPGESVFLDASVTACLVARLIAQRGLPLRVITNSLAILHELADTEVELVGIGGALRRPQGVFLGPVAVRTIRNHFADRFLFGVADVTADGVMCAADPLEAAVKRAMLEQTEQSVLLLDGVDAAGTEPIGSLDEVSLVLRTSEGGDSSGSTMADINHSR